MSKPGIFITGATSGMGLGLLKKYHSLGYRVGTLSVDDFTQTSQVLPDGVFYQQGDVSQPQVVQEALKGFAETGSVDIVVANAGISMPKAKVPDFDRGRLVIQVNVIGVINTFEAAIPIMKEQGHGAIFALSSVAGIINGVPGMAIYSASKAAVLSFCQTMHVDLKSYGIHVGAIAPGFVKTPLTADNKHTMPFSITMEEAVEQLYKAIQKKKAVHVFPKPMRAVSAFANTLPYSGKLGLLSMDLLKTVKE